MVLATLIIQLKATNQSAAATDLTNSATEIKLHLLPTCN